ncbi:hypothetical protein [Aureispira anguillae]|uniref:Uncharacterized protein n=1 Tax=Aureispira anguillae TaxID=2864201 RepID=A0A915YMH7_9BACT|nr:hypothetical protein [Aureispira anguillae]BDS15691.1 hypothetical protein AsAng_0064750 [Aureispira anguillae]
MDIKQKAQYIEHTLKFLNEASFPTSVAMAIKMRPAVTEEEKRNFRIIENFLEEFNLVEFIRGRDNSTPNGECQYFISSKGREMVKNNESIVPLLLLKQEEKTIQEMAEGFNKIIEDKAEKRAEQAELLLSLSIGEGLINLPLDITKKYFKDWFLNNHEGDLQIKDGDFVIEDGDFQVLPSFEKNDIPEFLKWFDTEKQNFIAYMKEKGVTTPKKNTQKNQVINNSGKIIFNESSTIERQSISDEIEKKGESGWNKASVIIAAVGVIIAILALSWTIWTQWGKF